MPNIDESHCELVSLRTVKADGCAPQERLRTTAFSENLTAEALAISSDEALS